MTLKVNSLTQVAMGELAAVIEVFDPPYGLGSGTLLRFKRVIQIWRCFGNFNIESRPDASP